MRDVNPALLFAVEYEMIVDRTPPGDTKKDLNVRQQWITKEADHALVAIRIYVINFFELLQKDALGKYKVHIGSI